MISPGMLRDITIVRAGSIADEYGSNRPSWATGDVTTALVSGWLGQISIGETRLSQRVTDAGSWVAVIPGLADIQQGDRIQDDDGMLYRVTGAPNAVRAGRTVHHTMVDLEPLADS